MVSDMVSNVAFQATMLYMVPSNYSVHLYMCLYIPQNLPMHPMVLKLSSKQMTPHQ